MDRVETGIESATVEVRSKVGLIVARPCLTGIVCFSVALASAVCAQEVPAGVVAPGAAAAVEKNPFDSPQDAELGRMTFVTSGGCSYCHSNDGTGGRGANLTLGEYRFGGSDAQLFETIR